MQQKTSGLSKGVYGNDFNIAMSLAMLRKTVPLIECNALSAVIKSATVRYSRSGFAKKFFRILGTAPAGAVKTNQKGEREE